MARELVIHIGDHKTGSTSIQDAMRRQTWRGGPSLAFVGTGIHHSSLAKVLRPHMLQKRQAKVFSKQAEMMAASGAEVCVLSSENFEGTRPEALKEAVETYFPEFAGRVRVIAYVRPHVDRIVSSWAENSKLGTFSGSMRDYADDMRKSGRFIYCARFEKWRAVFGEAFTLRPMIRSELHQGCVVRDFLRFALNTEVFEMIEEPAANESSSLEDLAMLRILHSTLRKAGFGTAATDADGKPDLESGRARASRSFGRNLAIALSEEAALKATKPRAHKALVKRLQAEYAQDAQALDAAFFDGSPMTRALEEALEKAVGKPQTLRPNDHFDADTLRLIKAWSAITVRMALLAPNNWVAHFTALRLGQLPGGEAAGTDSAETEDAAQVFGHA